MSFTGQLMRLLGQDMTVREWMARFRAERRRIRERRTVTNIGILVRPTRTQAVALLPIATWRLITCFVPGRSLLMVAIGLAIVLLAPRYIPTLLGL